jgi:hypothetical protein
LTIEKSWALGKVWYHDRLSPDFHRRTIEQALVIFEDLGLTGPFWSFVEHTPTP